jgi:undecaprenyl-diphosphatase
VAACLIGIVVLVAAFWLDPSVRAWMVSHRNRQWLAFMEGVSRYGDWPTHVMLGVVLAAIARWRGKQKWVRVFLAMLIACALAGAAARVIKVAVGRPRPSVKIERTFRTPRLHQEFHSFPSGHTASSTAFFAVLLLVSWRMGLPCLVVPLLIAFSRMYVSAHYLSDVVAAGILGVLCAWIVVRLMKLSGELGISTLNAQQMPVRLGPTSNAQ